MSHGNPIRVHAYMGNTTEGVPRVDAVYNEGVLEVRIFPAGVGGPYVVMSSQAWDRLEAEVHAARDEVAS